MTKEKNPESLAVSDVDLSHFIIPDVCSIDLKTGEVGLYIDGVSEAARQFWEAVKRIAIMDVRERDWQLSIPTKLRAAYGAKADLEHCYKEHEHEKELCAPEFALFQRALLDAMEEKDEQK